MWPHTTWTIKGGADKIYPWYQSHTKLGSRQDKFRDKIRKVFFMPHPWMYFGEYLCICIMTDVGHQTCHLHLPWSTIFWSFWHNINSQSDQTKMYVNIFRLGGNIFCGYIDYFPWNTQLSPCMWWILIRV